MNIISLIKKKLIKLKLPEDEAPAVRFATYIYTRIAHLMVLDFEKFQITEAVYSAPFCVFLARTIQFLSCEI